MTHQELLTFAIYQNACFESQAMCLCLVNYIEEQHELRPVESGTGYLQWHPNFALVQTLGVRSLNLTINLSGKAEKYHDIVWLICSVHLGKALPDCASRAPGESRI